LPFWIVFRAYAPIFPLTRQNLVLIGCVFVRSVNQCFDDFKRRSRRVSPFAQTKGPIARTDAIKRTL
jgi:hypothetical protein